MSTALRREEREAGVADVGRRDARQDVARPRAPQSDRRPLVGRIVELGRAIGRQRVREELPVAHPHAAAGHHPEAVVGEPHDRQVGEDPAGAVEQRRVDGPPGRDVDLVDAQPLEVGAGARPGHVEDGERRQVDDRRPVAHRQVLGVDDRRPPARFPFGGARHDPLAVLGEQALVRAVPVRPLPAGRLEEDGAELALARVERRQPDVAVRLPLLHRMDDAVGLVEALGRAGPDVLLGLVVVVEAGDVGAVRIDLRLARRHPLDDGLGDPGRLLDPDRRRRPRGP